MELWQIILVVVTIVLASVWTIGGLVTFVNNNVPPPWRDLKISKDGLFVFVTLVIVWEFESLLLGFFWPISLYFDRKEKRSD